MRLVLPALPFMSARANMTQLERWLRLLGGVLGAPVAYAVSVRPLDGMPATIALVVLVAGALDLVVSGVRGSCPVYRHVKVPWAQSGRSATQTRQGSAPRGALATRHPVGAAGKGRR